MSWADRIDAATEWTKGFFVPPSPLTDAPATWAELTAYAHHSVRMQNAPALVRFISSAWLYGIAFPLIAAGRWREWLFARPGRGFLAVLLVELILRAMPGGHALGQLIRSLYAGLAWLLLP